MVMVRCLLLIMVEQLGAHTLIVILRETLDLLGTSTAFIRLHQWQVCCQLFQGMEIDL